MLFPIKSKENVRNNDKIKLENINENSYYEVGVKIFEINKIIR